MVKSESKPVSEPKKNKTRLLNISIGGVPEEYADPEVIEESLVELLRSHIGERISDIKKGLEEDGHWTIVLQSVILIKDDDETVELLEEILETLDGK